MGENGGEQSRREKTRAFPGQLSFGVEKNQVPRVTVPLMQMTTKARTSFPSVYPPPAFISTTTGLSSSCPATALLFGFPSCPFKKHSGKKERSGDWQPREALCTMSLPPPPGPWEITGKEQEGNNNSITTLLSPLLAPPTPSL